MTPTTPETPTLEVRRTIEGSLEEVFAAWTDADLLARWFAPGALEATVLELDARATGRYRIRMRDAALGRVHTVGGRFLEVTPPRRLVMTWHWEEPEAIETQVTVDLLPGTDGTEVVVTHAGLPSRESYEQHRHGWTGCLEKLDTVRSRCAR